MSMSEEARDEPPARANSSELRQLFINERFAIVRPRLVAGRFIRKGSSLSFAEGVCVVNGFVYTVYHIKGMVVQVLLCEAGKCVIPPLTPLYYNPSLVPLKSSRSVTVTVDYRMVYAVCCSRVHANHSRQRTCSGPESVGLQLGHIGLQLGLQPDLGAVRRRASDFGRAS